MSSRNDNNYALANHASRDREIHGTCGLEDRGNNAKETGRLIQTEQLRELELGEKSPESAKKQKAEHN
jgi:hypothetical protein